MSKVYVFLAEGFEEVEGLTAVDLLRRAGVEVTTVSIMGTKRITGSNKITVEADVLYEDMNFSDADMLVLPGGGLGTQNLASHKPLAKLLLEANKAGTKIAAICAAPTVLAGLGLLKGKKATCYPSCMENLTGADKTISSVAVDGNIITSRGVGTAIDFALELIIQLKGENKAKEIANSIVYIV